MEQPGVVGSGVVPVRVWRKTYVADGPSGCVSDLRRAESQTRGNFLASSGNERERTAMEFLKADGVVSFFVSGDGCGDGDEVSERAFFFRGGLRWEMRAGGWGGVEGGKGGEVSLGGRRKGREGGLGLGGHRRQFRAARSGVCGPGSLLRPERQRRTRPSPTNWH